VLAAVLITVSLNTTKLDDPSTKKALHKILIFNAYTSQQSASYCKNKHEQDKSVAKFV